MQLSNPGPRTQPFRDVGFLGFHGFGKAWARSGSKTWNPKHSKGIAFLSSSGKVPILKGDKGANHSMSGAVGIFLHVSADTLPVCRAPDTRSKVFARSWETDVATFFWQTHKVHEETYVQ